MNSAVTALKPESKLQVAPVSEDAVHAALAYQPFRFRITYLDEEGKVQFKDVLTSDPKYKLRAQGIIGRKIDIAAQYQQDGCTLLSMQAIEELQNDCLESITIPALTQVEIKAIRKNNPLV